MWTQGLVMFNLYVKFKVHYSNMKQVLALNQKMRIGSPILIYDKGGGVLGASQVIFKN